MVQFNDALWTKVSHCTVLVLIEISFNLAIVTDQSAEGNFAIWVNFVNRLFGQITQRSQCHVSPADRS